MINASPVLGGFNRDHVPRRRCGHFDVSNLPYIASVADDLERELVAIREEIADIEGRLKDVAEKWEFGKSAGPS